MNYDLLRQNLIARFDDGEIRTLCFSLGVDYDNIRGETKSDKCRELILYLQRRDHIQDLVNACQRERPTMNWGALINSMGVTSAATDQAPGTPSPTSSNRVGAHANSNKFLFDVYVSFAQSDEATLLELIPHLLTDEIRVAIAGEIDIPGEFRVESIERGIQSARRTVVLLSPAYMADTWAGFTSTLAQNMAIEEQSARLVPVIIQSADLPMRFRALVSLDLKDRPFASRGLARLVQVLKSPL